MQSVTIYNTALQVSRLSFGTASLHRLYRQQQRLNLLEAVYSAGITHFDTSPYYGFGLAESDLGVLMRQRRASITVATKVGLYSPGNGQHDNLSVWLRKMGGKINARISAPIIDWSIQRAEMSLHESLKRLATDYLDILFLHEPDPTLLRAEEFLMWLEKIRSQGKIRYWGLAGNPEPLRAWLSDSNPLAMILQTKDSLDQRESDIVLDTGRPLQFTYGYISSSVSRMNSLSAHDVILKAIQRNTNGSIIFSTRHAVHVTSMTKLLS